MWKARDRLNRVLKILHTFKPFCNVLMMKLHLGMACIHFKTCFKIILKKEFLPLRVRITYPQHFGTFMGIIDENPASAKFKGREISLGRQRFHHWLIYFFFLLEMRWLQLPLEVPSVENSGWFFSLSEASQILCSGINCQKNCCI